MEVSDNNYLFMFDHENTDSLDAYFNIKCTIMLCDNIAPYEANFGHNNKFIHWLVKIVLELNSKDR